MKKKSKLKIFFGIILLILGITSIGLGINFNTIFKSEQKVIYSDIPRPVVEESEASLIMVGDALIHSAIYGSVKNDNYNFKPIFTEVKDLIGNYELAFYNQETILGGKELGLSNYPQFNSPQEAGDAFMDMGFNLVSLATNHTLDNGYYTNYKTIINSREYWDKQENVIAAGSYISQEQKDEIVVKEVNGIKYGLLAYTTLTNGLVRPNGKDYYLDVYSEELVKKDVEKLRDKVDLLMVSMHWGIEYSHSVSQEQKKIAKYLSSLGVDVVIGTHPHVVEPIEFIDDTLVIYSLGNFVSSQVGIEKLTGLVATIDIKKTTVDGKITVELLNPKADLVYTCKPKIYGGACDGYKVYPYNKLNNTILQNYKSYYTKYMDIVKSLDKNIGTIYSE